MIEPIFDSKISYILDFLLSRKQKINIIDGEISDDEIKDIDDEADWKINEEIVRHKGGSIMICHDGIV